MNKFLSESFLDKYRGIEAPLSKIGEFVYLRTYSRYLPELKRRETWFETVLRTVEYNIELEYNFRNKNGLAANNLTKEAELLFDNLFNLRTFTSGRTLYMGGTDIVKEYPLSNYNCCFTTVDKFHDFVDIFYLLMVGSGVGVRIDKNDIAKLPEIRNIKLINSYNPNLREEFDKSEIEDTTFNVHWKYNDALIIVGDSKEGWCKALNIYFDLITNPEYRNVRKIVIDYSYVRPEGERLARFGGRASGYKSLERMFTKINNVCNASNGKLKSIDVLDIATIISENVVSGGVRRSAMIISY